MSATYTGATERDIVNDILRKDGVNSLGLSVVMSTYNGDVPQQVFVAGESVFHQSRRPDEMVLVLDGPVDSSLEKVVERLGELGPIRVVQLEKNVGPGGARHQGILAAGCPVVAIMDADDVCMPMRFEKQLAAIEAGDADVVGGWIREFDEHNGEKKAIRKVPEDHEEVWRYAKRRSPMNNVTAMFRKVSYLKAGGYTSMRSFEDYDLYVRMLLAGARFRNLPEVMVEVRGGREMFKRRGGLGQVGIESAMLYRMYRLGFFNPGEFLFNLLIRTSMRLLPNGIRRMTYHLVLRN